MMERQYLLMKTLLNPANWFWWIACYVLCLLYSEETKKCNYLRLLHFAIQFFSFVKALTINGGGKQLFPTSEVGELL